MQTPTTERILPLVTREVALSAIADRFRDELTTDPAGAFVVYFNKTIDQNPELFKEYEIVNGACVDCRIQISDGV